MPEVKAAGLLMIRQLMAEATPGHQETFLASLTKPELAEYQRAVPTLWVDTDLNAGVMLKAARVLSPKDVNLGLRSLGNMIALDNLNGVYKVFLKVLTVPYVISKSGRMWQTYHSKGRVWAEEAPEGKRVTFYVAEYPEMPLAMREALNGFMEGLAHLTLAKDISVVRHDDDPNCWRWVFRWK